MIRAVITGDAVRPIPRQHLNVGWLYESLAPVLKVVTGQTPIKLFSTEAAYSMEEWLKLFTCDSSAVHWHLNQPELKEESVVIGFEIPTCTLKEFERRSVKYVDIVLHPVRFMDDVLVGVRCSGLTFPTFNRKFVYDDNVFKIAAGLVKSEYAYTALPYYDGSTVLFVGQTAVDRSLIVDGRVVGLADFREKINDVRARHTRWLFKRHPGCVDDAVVNFMKDLGCEIVGDSVYSLLSNDSIAEVCGISSSVLTEATYFGKKVTALHKPWYDSTVYESVDARDFYSTGFWAGMFGIGILDMKKVYPFWSNCTFRKVMSYKRPS